MTWYGGQASGTKIDFNEWNNMVGHIYMAPTSISGNVKNLMSSYIASTTALSKFAGSSNYSTHKTTYANTSTTGHLQSIDYILFSSAVLHSGNSSLHSFNTANYITSSNAISKFLHSGLVLNAVSSTRFCIDNTNNSNFITCTGNPYLQFAFMTNDKDMLLQTHSYSSLVWNDSSGMVGNYWGGVLPLTFPNWDFRWKGSGGSHLFRINTAQEAVGIGFQTPATKLHVSGAISSSTGIYADFISGNSSNLSTTTTLAGDLDGNISGASYVYGFKDIDFVSSQAISSASYKNIAFPADYIIDKDGTTYFARNAHNGSVEKQSSSPAVVINWAFQQLSNPSPNFYYGSGTVYLNTDVHLDNTLSGTTAITFDMGGHVIWPESEFTCVLMSGNGFTLQNGTIDCRPINAGMSNDTAMIRYRGMTGHNMPWPKIKNVDLMGGSWRTGKVSWSTGASGTAIYIDAKDSGTGLTGILMSDVYMTRFKYGIRGEIISGTSINGIYADNIWFNKCRYSLYLSGSRHNYRRRVGTTDINCAGHSFNNVNFEGYSGVIRNIFLGPWAKDNYIQGFTFDSADSSPTPMIECHESSNNNFFMMNGGSYGTAQDLDRVTDNSTEGNIFYNWQANRYRMKTPSVGDGLQISGNKGTTSISDIYVELAHGGLISNATNGQLYIYGGEAANHDVVIYANRAGTYPFFALDGAGDGVLDLGANDEFYIREQGTRKFTFDTGDQSLSGTSLLDMKPTDTEPAKHPGMLWMSSNAAGTNFRLYMISGDTNPKWKQLALT